ncbi:winged helix-turn-helix domain-containing protein [Promicromonospora sp. NPDC090134]|uniref:winged helix-turn-helix domain-containing protein n=1 Tax=Promicromonospora sp. NPDC090134 TaxID=3364408 RepID=UPI0038158C05
MTHDPAPGSTPGLVVCVGLPSDQIIEIARLLRGQATVLATPDADGARAVLTQQTAPRRAGDVPWRGRGAQPERFDNPGPADERAYGRHLSGHPTDRLPDNLTDPAVHPAPEFLPAQWTASPVLPVATIPAPARPATGTMPVVTEAMRPVTGPVPAVTGSVAMVAPPVLEPLVAGPLLVDLAAREVTALGRRVYLSAREFDLLATLALEAGRVWSFAELTARVWQLPYLGDSDPVTSAVKRLRKRLAPVRDVEVASVRGVGYRLKVWA